MKKVFKRNKASRETSDNDGREQPRNGGVQLELGTARETIPSADEPYDPHLYRNRPAPTTNWETLAHLLKGSIGTGILAMPKAFYHSGLIVGTVSTALIGVLCAYGLHILVQAQYELCKRLKVPVLSYPVSMQKALETGPNWMRPLAKPSAIIVDVFLIVYQLGICCVYIVFISKNIKSVLDEYVGDIHVRIYMLILLLPLILINYIKNLKLLAPASAFANVITFVGLGIIMYYVFKEPLQLSTLPYAGEFMNYPLFIGTTLFAIEAVGVVIALENNMATPKSFDGVLNLGMIFVTALYIFVGFFGYARYGEDAADSITLNLNEGVLSKSVQIIFAAAIFISYALQAYVPVEIIWNKYMMDRLENNPKANLYAYILRTVLVLVTFVFAVAIPNLGMFISLFGALCLSALGIAFPAIIELCVYWPNELGRFYYILIKDILLIIVGLFALVMGTYSSLLEIAK